MKKSVFLVLALLTVVSVACADSIVLKTGQQIEGAITDMNSSSVKVDLEGTEITYYLNEVQSINGEPIVVAEEPVAPVVSADIQRPEVSVSEVVETPSVPPVPIAEPVVAPKRVTSRDTGLPKFSAKEKRVAVAAAAIIFLVILVIVLVFYVYSAICLTFIAKKTGKEPAWLAWIPVGNMFLMCKIGGLSYWWLLVLLASFIPFVGSVAMAAFVIFLWYKIALARNKPGWLAWLLIIPIANLVVMGYLAFSD
jgi:hypothetical protein